MSALKPGCIADGFTRAIVNGSFSAATQTQVAAFFASGDAACAAEPLQLGGGRPVVDEVLARISQGLVEGGVGQLIIAGGETPGDCVQRLNITHLRIGPHIHSGVPWCHAPEQGLHVALKSGNFGRPDFCRAAFDLASTTTSPQPAGTKP